MNPKSRIHGRNRQGGNQAPRGQFDYIRVRTLLFCIALFSAVSAWSADQQDSSQVDDRGWSVSAAESIQSDTQSQWLDDFRQRGDLAEERERQQQQAARETGYGSIPHAPTDESRLELERKLRHLLKLQREGAAAGKSLRKLEQALGLLPADDVHGVSVSMVLRTGADGPVDTGGFVWTFDPDTRDYLGGSGIGAAGEITLPVAAGTPMDIMAFVNSPFAFQVVRDVTSAAGLDVYLENAVNLPVTVQDTASNLLDGFATDVVLNLKSYFEVEWPAGSVSGSGTIPVAPNEIYDATALPAAPYLAQTLINITVADSPLLFSLEAGATLTVEFNDPANLIGLGGCASNGSLEIFRSVDAIRGRPVLLSVPQAVRDGSSNLTGFVAAVPDRQAVDYQILFASGAGNCLIEDIRQRFAWFAGDNTLEVTLKPRPLPDVVFETPGGTVIPWSLGVVYPGDQNLAPQFFTPDSPPSLTAGSNYTVNVRPASGSYSVNEAVVTAQAGDFEVLLRSEPLTTVKSLVTIAGATNVSALIEFYSGASLVQAFEFTGGELTIQIPPGTYDVRVSGVTGRWFDSPNGRDFSIFLKPFTVQKTFTGTGSERMDFSLARPGDGITFALPWNGTLYHFTVLDGGIPVAAQTFYYWHDGILTDFSQLDLVLRGPGYHDQAISATPSAALPSIDIASLQGTVGRLQGTLKDAANAPIAGATVTQYAEDGIFGWSVATTNGSGQFDLPKIKNSLFVFQVPGSGGSVMHFRPVGDPAATENVTIQLEELSFNTVDESGEPLQLLYGTGDRGYQIVFLAEGYTALRENFTDTNANLVWDGALFIDIDGNGVWNQGEPFQSYGERVVDYSAEDGTDITAGNEAFVDQNGDGYPNINDFEVFLQNARNYVRSLLGTPDIAGNIEFDVYTLFFHSEQAGLDVVDASDVTIIERDTLYDAALLLNRSLLSIDYGAAEQVLDSYAPDRDLQIVMINQPVYAGRANSFILANGGIGNSSPNSLVAGHEFGHNPGTLADEYNEFSGTSLTHFNPALKHLTHRSDPDEVPWAGYVGPRDDLPISAPFTPGNGVYAGGSYNAGGAFRSTTNSRMRSNSPLFNAISLDVFSRALCLRSLTAADLTGDAAVSYPPGVIYSDGFEKLTGSGVLTNICD
jgi:hypothetical protein